MSKIKDSIYGFAIGDAIGVPIEFEERTKLMSNPVTKMLGYGSYDVSDGVWSDDTAMTLATIDSITQKNSIDYNDIADRFCLWLNESKYTATNEVFDIGITTKYALMRYWDNKTDATICGGSSYTENGNGSLMRMLPIALYCHYKKVNEDEILNIVRKCSSITHAHNISILGCYIYVRYLMFILNGKDKLASYSMIKCINYNMFDEESLKLYERILKDNIQNKKLDEIKSTGFVVDTLEAVLWVILNCDNFNQSIVGSINLGGDTDTIGAITGSIAGILYGYDNIQNRWIECLKGKEQLDYYITKFEKVMEV